MITCIVLLYIVFSLYFSFSNMKDTYTLFGGKYEALPAKEAFKEGFLVIPILILYFAFMIISIFCVGAVAVGVIIGFIWIATHTI